MQPDKSTTFVPETGSELTGPVPAPKRGKIGRTRLLLCVRLYFPLRCGHDRLV